MGNNRRNIWLTTIILGVVIAIAGIGGGIMLLLSPPPPIDPQPARVEYRITGDAQRIAVAFINDSGDEERLETTPPGKYTFRAGKGSRLAVNVKRLSESGAVGCTIIVDSRTVEQIAPDSGRAEASCSARVP